MDGVCQCCSEHFFLFFFRIWRIRCTLLSRGDARCWRISIKPEAPFATAKHQRPPSFSLFLALLPLLPSPISRCCSHTFPPFLPHSASPHWLIRFLRSAFPSSHRHNAAGSQNVTLASLPSFSFHSHLLRYIWHNVCCGHTRFNTSGLISWVTVWGFVSENRVKLLWHKQLQATCCLLEIRNLPE